MGFAAQGMLQVIISKSVKESQDSTPFLLVIPKRLTWRRKKLLAFTFKRPVLIRLPTILEDENASECENPRDSVQSDDKSVQLSVPEILTAEQIEALYHTVSLPDCDDFMNFLQKLIDVSCGAHH